MAGRDLPESVISQLEGTWNSYEYFFEAVFETATLRFWTGAGNREQDGKTWIGNGYLLSISNYSEDAEVLNSGNVVVSLSGLPVELAYFALNESKQKCTGNVYLAFFDENGEVIFFYPLFEGELSSSDIQEDPEKSVITLTYTDPFDRISTERESRWTPEEHKSRYPGDLGFDYVPFLRQQRVYWGRPDTTRQR